MPEPRIDKRRMRYRVRRLGMKNSLEAGFQHLAWAVFIGNTSRYYLEKVYATQQEAEVEALKMHALDLDEEIRKISEYLVELGEVNEDDPRGFLA